VINSLIKESKTLLDLDTDNVYQELNECAKQIQQSLSILNSLSLSKSKSKVQLGNNNDIESILKVTIKFFKINFSFMCKNKRKFIVLT
jgi:hypothetical protein